MFSKAESRVKYFTSVMCISVLSDREAIDRCCFVCVLVAKISQELTAIIMMLVTDHEGEMVFNSARLC